MAGGNPVKGSSNKPSASSSASNHRKSTRESGPNNTASAPSKPSPSKAPSNSKRSPASKHKPSPKLNPNPIPSPHPRPENFAPPPLAPPPPAYGFHMLDRRTIVLADGSARSYFALPPDYQDFSPPLPMRPDSWIGFDGQFPPGRPIPGGDDHYRQQNQDYWNSLGPEGSRKRKYGDERDGREGGEVNDEFARQRQQLLQYGNMISNSNNGSHLAGPSSRVHLDEIRAGKYMRPEAEYRSLQGRHNEVDPAKLKSAFFNFIRLINENSNQKKKYLADGKQGSLQCLACARSSKDFRDMHSLIMHTYNHPEKAAAASSSSSSDQVAEHLGLHKALCMLMSWNYTVPPDNSKGYQQQQRLSAGERDDLILWPPHVIIHNTGTGKGRDGRMEGLGNKALDMKLRDFGFTSGKSKAMFGREGHLGASVVKFGGDESGLKDALRLADFFEKQKRGRGSWAQVRSGKDKEEKDPKAGGEKERILYGYLGTVFDLDTLDFDTKKKVTIESMRERAQHHQPRTTT